MMRARYGGDPGAYRDGGGSMTKRTGLSRTGSAIVSAPDSGSAPVVSEAPDFGGMGDTITCGASQSDSALVRAAAGYRAMRGRRW